MECVVLEGVLFKCQRAAVQTLNTRAQVANDLVLKETTRGATCTSNNACDAVHHLVATYEGGCVVEEEPCDVSFGLLHLGGRRGSALLDRVWACDLTVLDSTA
eukprot:318318_1